MAPERLVVMTKDRENQLFELFVKLEKGTAEEELLDEFSTFVHGLNSDIMWQFSQVDYEQQIDDATSRLDARKRQQEASERHRDYLAIRKFMREEAQQLVDTLSQEDTDDLDREVLQAERESQHDEAHRGTKRKLVEEVEEQLELLESLRKKMRRSIEEEEAHTIDEGEARTVDEGECQEGGGEAAAHKPDQSPRVATATTTVDRNNRAEGSPSETETASSTTQGSSTTKQGQYSPGNAKFSGQITPKPSKVKPVHGSSPASPYFGQRTPVSNRHGDASPAHTVTERKRRPYTVRQGSKKDI